MRYIPIMFDVLVFVYENYRQGDVCPDPPQLSRRLTAAGFETDEIESAIIWLNGLNTAAQSTQIYLPGTFNRLTDAATPRHEQQSSTPDSLRVYSISEQEHLGASALGFISFLHTSNILSAQMREIVIDRAMVSPGGPLELDDLKIIVLMVYWSFGQEPDALVLDELCDAANRIGH